MKFTGQLSGNEVLSLMLEAAVFVYPSVPQKAHTEGQPRAVMEAMAAGLPVVASRAGGIPEFVHDGKGGRLVPPGDARALADALADVLGEPEMAKRMGQYNRALIESRDFGKIEQAVTALLERLAARNTRK